MIKLISYFSIIFLIFTLIISNFQLHGYTDNGFFISALNNFNNLNSVLASVDGGTSFSLLSFSPFMFIFSPIAKIFEDNPIYMTYLLYFITFLTWFIVVYKILYREVTLKKVLIVFLFFFSSEVILFHYGLNYNGFESVFFCVPFLMLSYYFAFIKNDIKSSILWYIPLLTIKFEFWFLIIFYLIALFVHFRKNKILLFTLIAIIAFIINLKFIQPILSYGVIENVNMLNERYGYIFESSSLLNLIENIFMLPQLEKKLVLIILFFIPFIFLINIRQISKKDFLIFTILLLPTLSYSILSTRIPMSYWTHEHYSLPLLPLIFIFIVKYKNFTKKAFLGYFLSNILIFNTILFIKQPWQFKYYADEKQLLNQVKPMLDLNITDTIICDNRTGLYFTKYQFDDLVNLNRYKRAKYIIINTRYEYLSHNYTFTKSQKEVTISDLIKNLNLKDEYILIYEKYPFLVYKFYEKFNYNKAKMAPIKSDFKEWERMNIEFNKWF